MDDEVPISHWIHDVKEGDSAAARQLWNLYYQRLVTRARRQLRAGELGMADEEDIAASVFESFYRAAKGGRFPDLSGRDDLWRLLLRMAARKIVDKRRYAGRQRRGGGESPQPLDPRKADGDEQAIIEVIGSEPSPEMVLMMAEACERLLAHLEEPTLRDIATGKMEGYTNAELAERFECSERTIERRLNLIREKCKQELLDQDE